MWTQINIPGVCHTEELQQRHIPETVEMCALKAVACPDRFKHSEVPEEGKGWSQQAGNAHLQHSTHITMGHPEHAMFALLWFSDSPIEVGFCMALCVASLYPGKARQDST
jgi:hypothetical protein